MKKWIVSAWVMLVLLVAFFPVEKGLACSGKAEIFNEYNERTGECELDVEVKQLKSLVFTYSKSFKFAIDGNEQSEFATNTVSETDDGLYMISQMFYDKESDMMSVCSLVYRENFDFVKIYYKDRTYIMK